ncbi:zinc ribbon domain-containing protein [Lentibacillus saliphilus]|uniref:zinc ribbon domain-containing protein n=1 Tax=Lentibacillus saliphilus TaxID=2737028 RepID=UPI001C2F846C|nr:zinc ribbon domain-containing protein [Lentibacillus saliphilus]
MAHCPYCGTHVMEDETYCIKCGKNLPDDMDVRLKQKSFDKYWYIPLSLILVILIAISLSYVILQHKTQTALSLYEQGVAHIEKGSYEKGRNLFQDAVQYHPNFNQAQAALSFTQSALTIETDIQKAHDAAQDNDFQRALSLVNETERQLDNFSGEAVAQLIDYVSKQRDQVKTLQLKHELQQDPTIDELKILLWDAEAIANEEAATMTKDIRERIIDFTFSKASEQINNNHFKDATVIVEDGLKYAPQSEKLLSLQTTIEKEQTAFETMQQERIEQAINTAVEEQQINENDAIELVSVSAKNDEQGNLLIEGKVKSVATIPINSISVEYALTTKNGEQFSTHHVYVYPDVLYPGEIGQFEFTHYDIQNKGDDIRVKVDTIKWYTN